MIMAQSPPRPRPKAFREEIWRERQLSRTRVRLRVAAKIKTNTSRGGGSRPVCHSEVGHARRCEPHTPRPGTFVTLATLAPAPPFALRLFRHPRTAETRGTHLARVLDGPPDGSLARHARGAPTRFVVPPRSFDTHDIPNLSHPSTLCSIPSSPGAARGEAPLVSRQASRHARRGVRALRPRGVRG